MDNNRLIPSAGHPWDFPASVAVAAASSAVRDKFGTSVCQVTRDQKELDPTAPHMGMPRQANPSPTEPPDMLLLL